VNTEDHTLEMKTTQSTLLTCYHNLPSKWNLLRTYSIIFRTTAPLFQHSVYTEPVV